MKRSMFFLMSVLLLSSFVSAFDLPPVGKFVKKVVDSVSEVLSPVLEPVLGTAPSEYLFAKVLLLIILFSVVYLVLGKIDFFEDSPFQWIVALVVGLLGIRYLSKEVLQGLTTNYSVLGILLLTLVPFIIYLYFLYTVFEDFPLLRRFGWALFAAVYIGLWASASGPRLSPGDGGSFSLGTAYGLTVLAAIILIFIDGWVHKQFTWARHAKSDGFDKRVEVANINAEIKDLEKKARTANPADKKVYEEQIKALTKHKHFLIKL
jgi:hypothetical protein